MNFIYFKLRYLIILTLLMGLGGCDIQDNNQAEPQNLVKIFDNEQFTEGFKPSDVQQTADGGFLILASSIIDSSDFFGCYVLKADAEGNFVSDEELPQTFVSPLQNLMAVGGDYYFFCMNNVTLNAKLMRVTAEGVTSEVAEIAATYPLAASLDAGGNGFVLYHYDRAQQMSVLKRVGLDGGVVDERSFTVGVGNFDVERPLIDHLTGTGQFIPFFTGVVGNNLYYFNGFFDFHLNLVLVDFSAAADAEPPLTVFGFQTDQGVNSALPLGGSDFAISRFSFGDNFILPRIGFNITSGSVVSSQDLSGNAFPELGENSKILLERIQVEGQNILLYASDTKGGQLILLAYDEATGVLLGTRRLGFSNPYEIGGFSLTADGGMVVVGTTFVAGRFPRISFFKLSAQDVRTLTRL